MKATNNEVESYFPALFAKALQGQNIEGLLSTLASAPVGGAAPASAAVAQSAAPAKVEGKNQAAAPKLLLFNKCPDLNYS